eukprot:jgi/Hompol1/531/HPOL_002530-RA
MGGDNSPLRRPPNNPENNNNTHETNGAAGGDDGNDEDDTRDSSDEDAEYAAMDTDEEQQLLGELPQEIQELFVTIRRMTSEQEVLRNTIELLIDLAGQIQQSVEAHSQDYTASPNDVDGRAIHEHIDALFQAHDLPFTHESADEFQQHLDDMVNQYDAIQTQLSEHMEMVRSFQE